MNISNSPITLDAIAEVLTKLAEKSESVYWLSSPDLLRIAYISPAYEKIWGRLREELYENPNLWINYLHPEDKKNHRPVHIMAEKVKLLGGAARYEEHYRIIRPNGEIRWIYDRGFPIYDENNNCCGVTGIALDVTREKLAEITLRNAKEQAEQNNLLKNEFIRNVEHDIRTPLSGIQGLATILSNQEKSSEKKEWLQDIASSARDLLKYCNDILDFSRIEHGVSPIINKTFNLNNLLTEVIAIETPAAKLKNLDLQFKCDNNVPLALVGDECRLREILINLASNAIKFTQNGGVKILADLLKTEDECSVIISISVQDTGSGIAKEKKTLI